MDNKITKKRMNNLFSYEWLMMIIIIVVCGFAWEFFYGVASVKPTVGQEFKYYFDMGVDSTNAKSIHNFLTRENAFSYDVLLSDYEFIIEEFQVLSIRLNVAEGDIIFSDGAEKDENGNDKEEVRAKFILDYYSGITYCLDNLLADARGYLTSLLKVGAPDGAEIDYANFDQNFDFEKIEAGFYARLGKDNRFRSKELKEKGIKQEEQRIKKLCRDVADFDYFLQNAPEEAFYRYTKYEQSYFMYKDKEDSDWYIDRYKPLYEEEFAKRRDLRYGINLGGLKGGRTNASIYFRSYDSGTAQDVIMMAFDFKEEQPELQYETISFMMTIIREFSDVVPA